jgi:hypothetical protein
VRRSGPLLTFMAESGTGGHADICPCQKGIKRGLFVRWRLLPKH